MAVSFQSKPIPYDTVDVKNILIFRALHPIEKASYGKLINHEGKIKRTSKIRKSA
jgi:hypothetical protein